jgi:hypothetical protein
MRMIPGKGIKGRLRFVGIKSPLDLASRHMEASASSFTSPKIKPGLQKLI